MKLQWLFLPLSKIQSYIVEAYSNTNCDAIKITKACQKRSLYYLEKKRLHVTKCAFILAQRKNQIVKISPPTYGTSHNVCYLQETCTNISILEEIEAFHYMYIKSSCKHSRGKCRKVCIYESSVRNHLK